MIPAVKFKRLYKCLNIGANCILANSYSDVNLSDLFNSKFEYSELNAIWNCVFNQFNTNGNFQQSLAKQITKDLIMDSDFESARPLLEIIYNDVFANEKNVTDESNDEKLKDDLNKKNNHTEVSNEKNDIDKSIEDQ